MTRDEITTGYVACQICGKPVLVHLPFVGCMFCGDCKTSDSDSWEASSEHFKQPFTIEELHAEYWPFFDKPVIRRIDA